MSRIRQWGRVPQRARVAFGYYAEPLRQLARWLLTSRETTNFTYDLEDRNRRYLAAQLADILEIGYEEALDHILELEQDDALREHIRSSTRAAARADTADPEARFGRRLGWYVFARVLKPRVVVETGVEKGLGACVLTAALKRNAAEGHAGVYYGTDLDPGAGFLLIGDYARFGKILRGDSLESLRKLDETIDLFINDSDHSVAYEAQEYEAIAARLSERAVILGDNAHCTDALLEFSLRTGRQFVFFQEKPQRHWYPGAGIGISFRRKGPR